MLTYINSCTNLNTRSTFQRLCETFFDDPYNKFSEIYRKNLKNEFAIFIYPIIGEVQLCNLSAANIEESEDFIRSSQRRNSFFLYRTDHMLRRICDYAIMHNLMLTSPCVSVPSVPFTPEYDLSYYDNEKLVKIVAAIKETRYPFLFGFGLTSGLVLPEILGIQISDYNSSEKEITIQRTVHLPRKGHPLQIGIPKMPRKIHIPKTCASILDKQISVYDVTKEAYGEVFPYIFNCDENNPVSVYLLQKEYHHIAREANLNSFSFASMRHNFIIHSLQHHLSIYDLQIYLGMKSPDYLLHLDAALRRQENLSNVRAINDMNIPF